MSSNAISAIKYTDVSYHNRQSNLVETRNVRRAIKTVANAEKHGVKLQHMKEERYNKRCEVVGKSSIRSAVETIIKIVREYPRFYKICKNNYF